VIASPDLLGVVLGVAVLLEIVREVPETGIEIVDAAGTSLLPNAAAMLAGMAVAAGVAVVLALALARVPWRYARLTLLLGMLVLGAALCSRAVEELASAGLVAAGTPLWDLSEALAHSHGIGRWLRMFTGYSDRPSVAEGLAWAGYVVVAVSIIVRSRPEPNNA
jgi:high-affinity iron transporter